MNDQYGKNIFPFIQTNVCLDKEGYKYQKKEVKNYFGWDYSFLLSALTTKKKP